VIPESQNIEFKVSISGRDEYLNWICGFANAYGGTLFIGKDYSAGVSIQCLQRKVNDLERMLTS
jgi:predicted HTH transcriptional regulator